MEAVKSLECSREGLPGVWGAERSEGGGGNWGGPVPVGTALAGGPPARSQRALLAHWAPTSGTSVEAHFGVGVRDAGGREPTGRETVHALPVEAVALAAAP